MSRRLEQVFSTKTPSIRWREEEQTAREFSKFCPEFTREKGKKEKKRRKEGRKGEERKKKGRSWYTLQQGRVLILLGISLSRGHSKAMELSPNIRAGSETVWNKLCEFIGPFGSRKLSFGAG